MRYIIDGPDGRRRTVDVDLSDPRAAAEALAGLSADTEMTHEALTALAASDAPYVEIVISPLTGDVLLAGGDSPSQVEQRIDEMLQRHSGAGPRGE